MKQDQLLQNANFFFDGCIQLLAKKSNDYAATTDALSNFKQTAEMAGVTVEQVFMVMLSIKYCRLKELSTGKAVKNESLVDTLVDTANYAFLLSQYLEEKNAQ